VIARYCSILFHFGSIFKKKLTQCLHTQGTKGNPPTKAFRAPVVVLKARTAPSNSKKESHGSQINAHFQEKPEATQHNKQAKVIPIPATALSKLSIKEGKLHEGTFLLYCSAILITTFLFFFFFPATLENFMSVIGKENYIKLKGRLSKEEIRKILDEQNFEKNTLKREILLCDLENTSFLRDPITPTPLPSHTGNDLKLQCLTFFLPNYRPIPTN
jgi:hypothetical protein